MKSFRYVLSAPLQAPEVVSLTTTSTSVHLKAKPPFFVSGPLVGFKLTVSRTKAESDVRIREIISHGNRTISEVITMLQPDAEYEVRLATINRYGVGPELTKIVRTRSQNLGAFLQQPSKRWKGFSYMCVCIESNQSKCGTWWRIGWGDYFQPEGRGFDSRFSRHVGTLGKFFTCSCLCSSAWNSDTVSVL